jgi:hypothetical protein
LKQLEAMKPAVAAERYSMVSLIISRWPHGDHGLHAQ